MAGNHVEQKKTVKGGSPYSGNREYFDRFPDSLLSVGADAKTSHGVEKENVLTGVMYLAPADLSGQNLCPYAKRAGCVSCCLQDAGRKRMEGPQLAALRRTLFMQQYPDLFWATLRRDCTALVAKARREGLTPAVRLNGTSDLLWEKYPEFIALHAEFPAIRWYDYTKYPKRNVPKWYDLTFSYSGKKEFLPIVARQTIGRMAVVFRHALPKRFKGKKVRNGDKHDARFKEPRNSMIGLLAKGRAKTDLSGFVV